MARSLEQYLRFRAISIAFSGVIVGETMSKAATMDGILIYAKAFEEAVSGEACYCLCTKLYPSTSSMVQSRLHSMYFNKHFKHAGSPFPSVGGSPFPSVGGQTLEYKVVQCPPS